MFADRFTGGGAGCHHRCADGGDGSRSVWRAGALSRDADVGGDRRPAHPGDSDCGRGVQAGAAAGGATTGKYAGVIYVSSTIAMLTTTAYTGGVWLALFFGFDSGGGGTGSDMGAAFLLVCTVLNLVHVNVFKLVITLGVYAEIVGSFGVALLLFAVFSAASII